MRRSAMTPAARDQAGPSNLPVNANVPRSVALLGDVMDIDCFGGAPRRFFDAAQRAGFAQHAWRIDLGRLRIPRAIWNLQRKLRGLGWGGFQFSAACRQRSLRQIPRELWATDVISFQQHFPPPQPLLEAGGRLNLYVDATYAQLFPAYGVDRDWSARTRAEAIAYEKEVFAAATRIVASQSWTLRSLLVDYGIPAHKCTAILPGPNYPAHPGLVPAAGPGRAGVDRPFVLGFIGKDWRRKGLTFLLEVAAALQRMGWRVAVRAIGFRATELDFPAPAGLECLGFIDKEREFGPFLHSCDVGCLFSEAEAAGIAVLEFLGAGVPAAGFTVNGLADLLPPDAGFRFGPRTGAGEVAERFAAFLRDPDRQAEMRGAAARWSPQLTWDRCVGEFREYWETGAIKAPVRLAGGAEIPETRFACEHAAPTPHEPPRA